VFFANQINEKKHTKAIPKRGKIAI
jgi:hypothetical protein